MFKDKFLIMTIDTSCKTTSCGLVSGDSLLSEFTECDNKTHSVKLMPLIDKSFTETGATIEDVDMIAVTNGPGSYTGLRIGVVTAKTFAYVSDIPLVGVNTLDALALACTDNNDAIVIPLIDARNTRVYAACYKNGELIFTHTALSTDELCDHILAEFPENSRLLFTGDGVTDANKAIINEKLKDFSIDYKDSIYPDALCVAKIAQNLYNNAEDKTLFTGEALGVNYMKKYNSEI